MLSATSTSVWSRVVLFTCLMFQFLATTSESLPANQEPSSNLVVLNEVPGTWSEWGEWIPCSRSCGAGVTTQNRTCLNGNCVGSLLQYMSCCIRDCPADQLDFRAEQCMELGKLQGGAAINWMPSEEDNEGCSLKCVSETNNAQTTSTTLITFARDGTSCKTVEGHAGVCLGKMCAKVGCDGILGSDKIEDSCLQCHSPGSDPQYNCQRFASVNTPNQAAMEGNLAIVIIPQGVATLTIKHTMNPGQGMLALKSSLGNYLYSHGMTESLRDIAGAEFQRTIDNSGPHPIEILTSKGPLLQRITVELTDVNNSTPMVEYEYYIAESSGDSTGMHNANHTTEIPDPPTDPDSEYAWMYDSFSNCSVSCGTGVKIAMARCKDLLHPERLKIPDTLCSRYLETQKPFPLLQKCLIEECPPSWVAGEWSDCSAMCGNGTQSRALECRQFIEEGKETKYLPNNMCEESEKLPVERECNTQQCLFEWSTGPWNECPTQCGTWYQNRSVSCVETATRRSVDSDLCERTHMPLGTRRCDVPCRECHWVASKFRKCNNACGYGTQTRPVRCRYRANNSRTSETCCANLTKPETTQPCYDTRGSRCRPDWETYSYGQCEGDCCGEMRKERRVICGAVSSGELVVFPDRECNATTKPVASMSCNRSDCPRWERTSYGACDVTCGHGNRYRDVTCKGGDGQTLTDDQCECMDLKPPIVEICPDLPSCPVPTTTPDTCDDKEDDLSVCINFVHGPSDCENDYLAGICALTCCLVNS